jgi:hypothetical protein
MLLLPSWGVVVVVVVVAVVVVALALGVAMVVTLSARMRPSSQRHSSPELLAPGTRPAAADVAASSEGRARGEVTQVEVEGTDASTKGSLPLAPPERKRRAHSSSWCLDAKKIQKQRDPS